MAVGAGGRGEFCIQIVLLFCLLLTTSSHVKRQYEKWTGRSGPEGPRAKQFQSLSFVICPRDHDKTLPMDGWMIMWEKSLHFHFCCFCFGKTHDQKKTVRQLPVMIVQVMSIKLFHYLALHSDDIVPSESIV
uniref:Putative secreted protein n=1 Tax=Anopheles marajoara TaxID=58244 RepID=A0A2M4C6T7_9DIPT